MLEVKNSPLTFVTGCAINRDMYYIACSPDAWRESEDTPYTIMCFYQHQRHEKWFYHELPAARVVSVAYPPVPDGQLRKAYALSDQGTIECYSREGSTFERVRAIYSDEDVDYLYKLRSIGDEFYVCGTKGHIYKKGSAGWVAFDDGIRQFDDASSTPPPLEDSNALLKYFTESMKSSLDLVDINGRDNSVIYAVGNDGFIAHHDGASWHKHKKLTSAGLNAIHVDDTDEAIVVGASGTVLKGSAKSGFSVVSRKELTTDFYSITSFNGAIYIGAGDGLYEVENGTPKRMKISDTADLEQVNQVESIDGVLWVLSEKKLLRYDGKRWEEFEHPNNLA